MSSFVIAASASSDAHIWTNLFEVIAWGLVAGVGLPIIFGLAMRGLIVGSAAQREGGRGAYASAQLALGAFFSIVCVGAVVLALFSMLHR